MDRKLTVIEGSQLILDILKMVITRTEGPSDATQALAMTLVVVNTISGGSMDVIIENIRRAEADDNVQAALGTLKGLAQGYERPSMDRDPYKFFGAGPEDN